VPAPLSTIASPSVTLNRDIPQTNGHTAVDTSTKNTQPLNVPNSPSKPNSSDSAALSASSKPNVRSVSDSLPAILKELSDAQLALKEVLERIASITQRLQNVQEGRQAEPESGVLRGEGQTRAEKIKPHDQDESAATENETETEEKGWDADVTLAEDQSPRPLEKVTLKTVDGVRDGISTGEANAVLKGLDRLKVPERKAPPVVGGVS
jgi:hypothetical protein